MNTEQNSSMIRKQKISAGFTKNKMIRLSGDNQIKSMAKFALCLSDFEITHEYTQFLPECLNFWKSLKKNL